MKKVVWLGYGLVLLMATSVYAQTEGILLYFHPEESFPARGETLRVEVRLAPRGFQGVTNVFAFMGYDREKMLYNEQESSVNTAVFNNQLITAPRPREHQEGVISFPSGSLTPIDPDADVLVATLFFLTLTDGDSELEFINDDPRKTEVTDAEFVALSVTMQSAIYRIGGVPATPSTPVPTPLPPTPTIVPDNPVRADANQDGYLDYLDAFIGGLWWVGVSAEDIPGQPGFLDYASQIGVATSALEPRPWTGADFLALIKGWHQEVGHPTLRISPGTAVWDLSSDSTAVLQVFLTPYDDRVRMVMGCLGYSRNQWEFIDGEVNRALFDSQLVPGSIQEPEPGVLVINAGSIDPLPHGALVATVTMALLKLGPTNLDWLDDHATYQTNILDGNLQPIEPIRMHAGVYEVSGPTPTPVPPARLWLDPPEGEFTVVTGPCGLEVHAMFSPSEDGVRFVQGYLQYDPDLLLFHHGVVNTDVYDDHLMTVPEVRSPEPGVVSFFAGSIAALPAESSVAVMCFEPRAGGLAELEWLYSESPFERTTMVLDESFQPIAQLETEPALYQIDGPLPVWTPTPDLPLDTPTPSPTLTPTLVGGNLIINGGAEWGSLEAWEVFSFGDPNMPMINPEPFGFELPYYEGNHYFGVISVEAMVDSVQYQTIQVTAGTEYFVQLAYVLVPQLGGSGHFSVSWIDGAFPGYQQVLIETNSLQPDWTLIPEAAFVPSGNDATIVIRSQQLNSEGRVFCAYDAVECVAR